MISVAIANQKGGVGKTTVTLGFAEAALHHGFNVLVVDCDPQANATAGLGVSIEGARNNLSDVLEDEVELTSDNIGEYVLTSEWSTQKSNAVLDVLPAHPRLSQVEAHIANDPIGSCDRLAHAIKAIRNNYDLILFDCPPSMGLLTINALFAADRVVIVSAPSAWSSDGVEAFVKNVDRIAQRRDGRPFISGIVVNNVGRTRDGKYWESEIANRYAYPVKSIAARAAIAEASAMSSTIRSLGSRAGAQAGVDNFNEVFLELIGIVEIQDLKVPAPINSIAAAI